MATNLAIDDKLLEEARIVGKHVTKKAVVNEALGCMSGTLFIGQLMRLHTGS